MFLAVIILEAAEVYPVLGPARLLGFCLSRQRFHCSCFTKRLLGDRGEGEEAGLNVDEKGQFKESEGKEIWGTAGNRKKIPMQANVQRSLERDLIPTDDGSFSVIGGLLDFRLDVAARLTTGYVVENNVAAGAPVNGNFRILRLQEISGGGLFIVKGFPGGGKSPPTPGRGDRAAAVRRARARNRRGSPSPHSTL